MQYNLYQKLLQFPSGGAQPVPDAASHCGFQDHLTYVCQLKHGLRFSNGSPLTAADVVFSYRRVVKINASAGPSYQLSPLKSVSAPNPSTVVFTLKRPNPGWPLTVASLVGSIVPRGVFPADKAMPSAKVIGSGPYKLSKFQQGQLISFKANPHYSGPKPANSGVIVQYYQQPSAMRLALQQKQIDAALAWRAFTPPDLKALRGSHNIIKLKAADVRYLGFSFTQAPVKNLAVRQAIAYLINRNVITHNVDGGLSTPLYSIVPTNIPGSIPSFRTQYGASPNPAKAKQVLQRAGIHGPIKLTIWYTPTHWGPTSQDEFGEIQRELNSSGLFHASVNTTAWDQYEQSMTGADYQAYETAWYPDFPDADQFLDPELNSTSAFSGKFSSKHVDQLLAQEEGTPNQSVRPQIFAQLQDIAAREVTQIPLFEANVIIAANKNLSSIAQSVDPIDFNLHLASWRKG
ncbi:MAG: ABC transporter substrate-binding protein [bacterium]|jgi:peptide/nickel transport system substrate-binding protein|nr:ABC transporter substrate-binding protein [bacterium]